ncbi:MAG: type IV pilus twitching motility protein PilT [Planctomycetota bacterium]
MPENAPVQLSNADQMFLKIALKNNLVTQEQLRECTTLLQRGGTNGDLADLLLAKGYVAENHIGAIRRKIESMADGGGAKAEAATKADPAAAKSDASKSDTSNEAKPKPVRSVPSAPAGATQVADIVRRDFSLLAGKPLGEYLKLARELGASDFHFQVDSPPMLRLHGHLIKMKHPVITPEDAERAIRALMTAEEWEILQTRNDCNFCFDREPHGRYRTNAFRQRKGLDIVFRVIPAKVPTLEELHLPDSLRQFTLYRQGLVLITGPAGSGKSSTMAALIEIINNQWHDHIITVEDPIEFMFQSRNCNVNQRHVEVHTKDFGTALRSAMRADPDVICVGEMRDLETISMAVTAAETGHLVMGTLHTTNAIRSIDRVIDVFPPKEQEQIRAMVSESMRGVISQQLIPRADGLGREPALEIMFATPAVSNMIRENKTFQLISVLQTGRSKGMTTMDDSIEELLNKGLITRDEAIFRAEDSNRFKK